MANTKLLFCDSKEDSTLEVFWNNSNEITLWIEKDGEAPTSISLDKLTSIKLVKTLKSEISKIKGGTNV
jgi:hypothetical protein